MFYAAEHRYDTMVCNDYIILYRFGTKAQRDEYVEGKNFEECGKGNLKTEAVTRDEARRHFPDAFRMVGDFHDASDVRDWRKNDGCEFWSTDNLYEY